MKTRTFRMLVILWGSGSESSVAVFAPGLSELTELLRFAGFGAMWCQHVQGAHCGRCRPLATFTDVEKRGL